MKHLLNEMSENEKDLIRQQYSDKIKVNTEKFNKLIESKLGDVKPLLVKEQSMNAKPSSNLKSVLSDKVGVGSGSAYKEICDICSKQDLNISNPRAKKAAEEFSNAIEGGENPFSNFGGSGTFANKESSAYKAGDALRQNLTSAEDICTMIKYYSTYSGSGEDFCEAVTGELSYKVDSTSNLNLMVGEPIYDILNK